jgi:serine/threonine protein phosphatase 1
MKKAVTAMLYILSDIHGNEDRFASILKQIQLKPTDTLYVLGDVIDRHDGGIRILRRIMAMPNAKMLLGNHEYMMLRALGHPCDDNVDNGTALPHWYRNGGQVTHDHFKRLRKVTRAQIIDYLLSLPLHYDVEANGTHYRLVHATPAEDFAQNEDPRYLNPTHFTVWKRWEENEFPTHDYTVIFGHTPTKHYRDCTPMEIWRKDGYIDIDCGCGYPTNNPQGRLCCLRLDDGKVFYSEENL